jgi:hypothetical protein
LNSKNSTFFIFRLASVQMSRDGPDVLAQNRRDPLRAETLQGQDAPVQVSRSVIYTFSFFLRMSYLCNKRFFKNETISTFFIFQYLSASNPGRTRPIWRTTLNTLTGATRRTCVRSVTTRTVACMEWTSTKMFASITEHCRRSPAETTPK